MMRERALVAVAIALITAVGFWWFPGHTILQSDTQIYVPILEHLRDPSVLANDAMASRPHVGFTIYDETALFLRCLIPVSYEPILMGEQLVLRALGVLGLFLMARAAGLGSVLSLAVAALVSLGATVNGPQVLTVEYEPVPRGFALPLILLALGCIGHGRWMLACCACALAWAFHPPTAMPVWLILGVQCVMARRWPELGVLAVAPVVIALSVLGQGGVSDSVPVFARLSPELEGIQRMRASYGWAGMWLGRYWLHFVLMFALSMAAAWRISRSLPASLLVYFYVLPVLGVASVGVSWLLLDQWKWAIMSEYQPARYLLFVTLFAALSCGTAGLLAAVKGRGIEAVLFLLVPFAIPLEPDVLQLSGTRLYLAIAFATVMAALVTVRKVPAFATVAVAMLAFAVYPTVGRVINYPEIESSELNELIQWARGNTAADATFQFADVRRGPEPGVFRARALRPLYVDWKGGGQVNFLPQFAVLWNQRWKDAERPQTLPRYAQLGVQYVVFRPDRAPKNVPAVYANGRWKVFRLGAP